LCTASEINDKLFDKNPPRNSTIVMEKFNNTTQSKRFPLKLAESTE